MQYRAEQKHVEAGVMVLVVGVLVVDEIQLSKLNFKECV